MYTSRLGCIQRLDSIQESWITIFSNTDRIKFVITNTKVRTLDNNIAVVVCLENIETILENRQAIKIGVNATNIFEKNEQNKWLLVHHHGSPVTNYFHRMFLLNDYSNLLKKGLSFL